jgi:hypothetical protein
MDENEDAAAGQLLARARGVLVIDGRELLTSTRRVVGVQLGELHFRSGWRTLHVAHGTPADGRGASGVGEFCRIV